MFSFLTNDLLATPYVCTGENIFASDVKTQGIVEVIVNGKDVTKDVKEDGQGIDLVIGDSIEVIFVEDQTIDSVVILPKSNVESYYISYETTDGYETTLEEVSRPLPFEKSNIPLNCLLESTKARNKIQPN